MESHKYSRLWKKVKDNFKSSKNNIKGDKKELNYSMSYCGCKEGTFAEGVIENIILKSNIKDHSMKMQMHYYRGHVLKAASTAQIQGKEKKKA